MAFIDARNLFDDIAKAVRAAYTGTNNSVDLYDALRAVDKMELYFKHDYLTLWRMEREDRERAEHAAQRLAHQPLSPILNPEEDASVISEIEPYSDSSYQ
jgi:hypothetical protein